MNSPETPSSGSAPPPAPPPPAPPTSPPEAQPSGSFTGGRGLSAGRALGGLGIMIVLVAIEAVVVAAFDPDLESLASRLGLQTALAATMLGVALMLIAPGEGLRESARALGLRRPQRPYVGRTIGAYFAYIGCALVIAVALEPEQEDVTRELGADEGVLGSIVAGLLIVGIAPVAEESFFRGFLFAGIRRSANFVVAALISGAIFGLFHYTDPDSWGVVLQLAAFGAILAWLYERTNSIWPAVAVHTLNNAIAFSVLISS